MDAQSRRGIGEATDVAAVMSEIQRIVRSNGLLVLAVLAGEPSTGLPHVQLFSKEMFDEATAAFTAIEKCRIRDAGCTGKHDYVVARPVPTMTVDGGGTDWAESASPLNDLTLLGWPW